mmetsp:Transcript_6540/g.8413  ORF Transcript_6540/g.8413 Transcript_6540/m.8413 type:complete len:297 (+) Transcript_6540:69-959(+)
MSTPAASTQCAACGKSSNDLKTCNACKLVKYCNVTCQKAHRPKHKTACKHRAAELHEKALFSPPPPKQDCPICCLPLPISKSDIQYQYCCGQHLCTGCIFFHMKEFLNQEVYNCPFCRMPATIDDDAEYLRRIHARIDAGDAEAMHCLGCKYSDGEKGLTKNHQKAMEWWSKAAKLGLSTANRNIAAAYYDGRGVPKDPKKEKYYHEIAAMAGHVSSRSVLGTIEYNEGHFDRAYKHWMMAAKAGCTYSLKEVQEGFENRFVTKEQYEEILVAFKDSVDEMQSVQRDHAVAFASLC